MKILFWTDGFWPRLGGIETQSLQLIEMMQKRGHEYIVLAQKDNPSFKQDETYTGIYGAPSGFDDREKSHIASIWPTNDHRKMGRSEDPQNSQNLTEGRITIKRFDFNAILAKRDLSLIRPIKEYLEWIVNEFQPDIVHLNTCIGGSAFVFSLFLTMFQMPIVLTAYAPYIYENRIPPIIEKIVHSADQICCISNWVLQEMEKFFPAVKSKLRLIYCGLSMPDTAPTPPSFSPPILLLFGRLSWEKGFDVAIQAFSLLKKERSDARLIVAGGGPERPSLEKLVSELNLNDSVQFTGVLTNEEALLMYNQASLVIVPSILESFGLVILESMQMERPVIAFRVQGVPEVISEGETGLLVSERNPAALCTAIQTLLKNPEKAVQMGIQGRKRAQEQFPIDQCVQQFEDLCNQLLCGCAR